MASGNFTKEKAKIAQECIDEIFKAVPKTKQMELLGELNELSLFVSAAGYNAPSESEKEAPKTSSSVDNYVAAREREGEKARAVGTSNESSIDGR